MLKYPGFTLLGSIDTLNGRLEELHNTILARIPHIARIACALYDPETDLLKTFINSTHEGHAIVAYEYPLSESRSLFEMSESRLCRVIDDVISDIAPGTAHSDWLLEQGYRSSFTIPMFNGHHFLGFIFVDSHQPSGFTETVQRDLVLYCNLIVMAIASEITAVRSLLATAQAAREFANLRDFETGAHLSRMAHLSRLIAKAIAAHYQLSDETVEHIYLFAPLHDIGKIGIPDRILLKPGRLDQDERLIMQGHVSKGVAIIEKVLDDYELAYLKDSKVMLNIVACHHEFMDGSGYPQGLKGEKVPIEARIVTVADIFDALTSTRPYKESWSAEDAIVELEKMAADGKLDPFCVAALRENLKEARRIEAELVDP